MENKGKIPPRKEDFSYRKYIALFSFVELAFLILKRWPDGSDGALIPSPGCQLEVLFEIRFYCHSKAL